MGPPNLYYDLGSPYAYLAIERASDVLGVEPNLEPVLVGGIFVLRGSGSWSQTPERDRRIAELEERAARYGMAPLKWPPTWPDNTLKAMRAATWAAQRGLGREFSLAAFRAAFVAAADLSRVEILVEIATAIGLPGEKLPAAIEDGAIKRELKLATSAAWERGVVGVPCVGVADEIFYGDDRLEDAAAHLRAAVG